MDRRADHAPGPSRRRTLTLLGLLYVCEGLPYGFQATALPVFLRSAGLSLAAIGFLGALGLPWILKPLWAPWIEARGRRRTWILGLQLLLAMTAGGAALARPGSNLGVLLGLVFAMNLVAATLDIVVDGLAVDMLEEAQLGVGNAAQVVGYKIGMIGGGGVLVWASAELGWSGLFTVMSLILLAACGASARLLPSDPAPASAARAGARSVVRSLRVALGAPGAKAVIVLAGTYKLGETLTDVMWKPYLVDAGYRPDELGIVLGTLALGFSLIGSLAGGLWATKVGAPAALAHLAGLRTLALIAIAVLVVVRTQGLVMERSALEAVTMAEAFFGGALTTSMFAFMMARVDCRVGATHFTVLAAVEVLGKAPVAMTSGLLAEVAGYPATFITAAALSLGFSVVLPHLAPSRRARASSNRRAG